MLDMYRDTQEAAKTMNLLHIVLAAELLYGSEDTRFMLMVPPIIASENLTGSVYASSVRETAGHDDGEA